MRDEAERSLRKSYVWDNGPLQSTALNGLRVSRTGMRLTSHPDVYGSIPPRHLFGQLSPQCRSLSVQPVCSPSTGPPSFCKAVRLE